MDGEGKKEKKKCFTIKVSKTGKKYITLRGKKLYLKTLMKKANKKRMVKGKKPLQRITKQNIENVLLSVINDVKKVKDIQQKQQLIKKVDKESKKVLSKLSSDIKKDIKEDKEDREDIIKKAGKNLLKDLEPVRKEAKKIMEEKKKKKRVKIKVVEEEKELPPTREVSLAPTRITTSPRGERRSLRIAEQKSIENFNRVVNSLQERLQEDYKEINRQLGGMLLDKDKALDNTEIERIMNKYKEFKGVYPLDMVYKAIPLIEPKSEGGLILNLDKSGEPGVHWCSIYWNASNSKPQICYYDSFARAPRKETIDDIKNIVKKLNSDKHIKLKINGVTNQDKSSVSCGYLCIKFLMDMFRNGNFKKATGYGIKKSEEQAEQLYDKFKYML
jgi:hypothetical protein